MREGWDVCPRKTTLVGRRGAAGGGGGAPVCCTQAPQCTCCLAPGPLSRPMASRGPRGARELGVGSGCGGRPKGALPDPWRSCWGGPRDAGATQASAECGKQPGCLRVESMIGRRPPRGHPLAVATSTRVLLPSPPWPAQLSQPLPCTDRSATADDHSLASHTSAEVRALVLHAPGAIATRGRSAAAAAAHGDVPPPRVGGAQHGEAALLQLADGRALHRAGCRLVGAGQRPSAAARVEQAAEKARCNARSCGRPPSCSPRLDAFCPSPRQM